MKALVLFEISRSKYEEVRNYLHSLDYKYFFKQHKNYIEVSIVFDLEHEEFDKNPKEVEVYNRMKMFEKTRVKYDVSNLYSLFEINQIAQDLDIVIEDFSPKDNDSYFAIISGKPSKHFLFNQRMHLEQSGQDKPVEL